MKIYCVERHEVLEYKEAEISEEIMKELEENNIDITDTDAVTEYLSDNDYLCDMNFDLTNQYWTTYEKVGYESTYSIEPFDKQYKEEQ
jgi:NADH dehydrogenase FAD-containing subunit